MEYSLSLVEYSLSLVEKSLSLVETSTNSAETIYPSLLFRYPYNPTRSLYEGNRPNHLHHIALAWRLPQVGRGRRSLTFLDSVARDTGLDVGNLIKGAMLDRAVWRKIVEEFSIVDRPK